MIIIKKKNYYGSSTKHPNCTFYRSYSEFARSLILSEISNTNVRDTNRRKETAAFNQLIPDIVHILTLTNKRHFEFESANKWFGKVRHFETCNVLTTPLK